MELGGVFASLYASDIGLGVMASRMLVACILGAVLGIDREILSRPAGIRTHILVCLAAATFTVVTFELLERARSEGSSSVDPIRIVEAVTAGVAFLAAGAIIRARGRVHGVTTGAGLWLAGAVGTACGIGAFPIAIMAALLGLIILTLLRTLDRVLPQKAPPPGRGHGDGDEDQRVP
jgi:putative Mg2+ transporter-C (MgtC) family protein